MQQKHRARLLAALLLCGLPGCQEGAAPQTSSSSHWIRCESDADCSNLPMVATCGSEGYCVDSDSSKVELQSTYETEFDGTTLDGDVFGFETGFALRNQDDQFYTERSENAFLEDGELVLVARAESYEQAEYTSASIETRGRRAFTFGRIEAEISMPTGAGVGPSFWMLPEEPGPPEQTCDEQGACFESAWPVWGDVVIASLRSEDPSHVLSGVNYASEDGAAGLLQAQRVSQSELNPHAEGAYHVYRIDWGPERIDWFIDDEAVHSFDVTDSSIYHPAGRNPFHEAFHLKLALAVGGLSEPPVADDYPQELRVRWLRVSQYD